MRRIPLRARDGQVRAWTLVDDADFERFGEIRWYLSAPGYACRSVGGGRKEYLHRAILGLAAGTGVEVDHIDGDRLNNRSVNLRAVSHAENAQNKSAIAKTSRHRGVSWVAARRVWRAHAKVNGRLVEIGRFADELDAARAASDYRRTHMPFANPDRDFDERARPQEVAA